MTYTHLAISGGGTKGVSCIGSLLYLEKHDLILNVSNILGTSVGAIIASLLTIYSVEYISKHLSILFCIDLNQIDLRLLFSRYGMLSKKPLIEKIEGLLLNTFPTSPTFIELNRYSNKNLTITALNLNTQTIEYFSHKTHPDMRVIDAISMSINIPILFEIETYNNNLYIDAAVIDNMSWNFYSKVPKAKKIGIYMTHSKQQKSGSPITNLSSYMINILRCFYLTTVEKNEQFLLHENIIILKDETSVLDMYPSKDNIENMIKFGYYEMELYLKKIM